jgi:hypothetical protein
VQLRARFAKVGRCMRAGPGTVSFWVARPEWVPKTYISRTPRHPKRNGPTVLWACSARQSSPGPGPLDNPSYSSHSGLIHLMGSHQGHAGTVTDTHPLTCNTRLLLLCGTRRVHFTPLLRLAKQIYPLWWRRRRHGQVRGPPRHTLVQTFLTGAICLFTIWTPARAGRQKGEDGTCRPRPF